MASATPVLSLLRALDPDQRQRFAEEVGSTVVYLYQLAGQPDRGDGQGKIRSISTGEALGSFPQRPAASVRASLRSSMA